MLRLVTDVPTEPDLELAIFVGNAVAIHPLREGSELTLGRDEVCGARLDDGSVSRKHATIRREGDGVYVRDLGSANGTCVREIGPGDRNATLRMRPVGSGAVVKLGAVLLFGAVLGVVRRSTTARAPAAIVSDPAMRALYDRAFRAAGSRISVLVLGETGVGKEVLARAIHDRSPRAAGRFLALSCAALSPTLIESELFGHEKGAFTGATQANTGLLESANGGTVFLDEIGELPSDVQVKLLRVLEERAVLSVGGRAPRPIDVRIVSATHRDLEADCRAGRFRQDLFFRLDGMSLTIPPLRKRPSEILELARFLLAHACESGERLSVPAISSVAAALLERYAWPGNVRELKNAMELAAVLCTSDEILADHLPDKIRTTGPVTAAGADGAGEHARVLEALERCDGNQTRAAELLGVSRRTLVSRLTEYGLTRPRKPST